MCANPRKLLLAATAGLLTYLAWPRYAATQTEPPPSALEDYTATYRDHGGTAPARASGDATAAPSEVAPPWRTNLPRTSTCHFEGGAARTRPSLESLAPTEKSTVRGSWLVLYDVSCG
jgi:hypothetical protein